ncbi:hypothetical protein [Saccharothrix stipae]
MTRGRSRRPTTSARALRLALVRYSFATACGVAVLISVALIARDDALTATQIYSAVGLNVIASVVFALVFATLANWTQDRHLRDTLTEGMEEVADRFERNMARTNRLFLPSKHYDALNPTDGFGDPYNEDMTLDLQKSGFFAFYGPNARFVAARLLTSRHRLQQIRIAMINPGNRKAVSRSASDRMSTPRFRGRTIAQIEQELENELLMNLVSLFDCRWLCPVEILYNEDTAVYRYVMLDESVYVSWYHSPQSTQMELPESYRFGRDSFLYSTFRMELMRKFEISHHKVVFEATDDDTKLTTHLRTLTGREITAADLARWRSEQEQDSAAFRHYLGTLRQSSAHHLSREDRSDT